MTNRTRGTVLLIAYYYPPDPSIGGARPFRMKKYLERLGYRVALLTAAAAEGLDVVRVPDPLPEGVRHGWAFQAERFAWKFVARTGLRVAWSHQVWRAGKEFLDTHRGGPVTIISTAPPFGTHLAAWRLARYSGSRWVADFRDPLYLPNGDQATFTWAAPGLEAVFIRGASLVLANTDAMAQLWRERYPSAAGSIHTLWNGYDPEDEIPPRPAPAAACRVVSHVGELYGGRDIKPLVYALARLLERGAIAAGSMKIRQIGPAEERDLPAADLVRKGEAEGWLELRAPVAPAVARELALDSDGLLLLQPHTALQVPGKLFEYLRMGRPILAYIVPDSPVEHILRNSGVAFEAIFPGDTGERVEAALVRFAAKMADGPGTPSAWFAENFEASRQAGTLVRLMEGA